MQANVNSTNSTQHIACRKKN